MLIFDHQGKATGKLRGKRFNGQEKLRRVLECINNPKKLYAYGDSNGAQEILSYATHPYYRTLTRFFSWQAVL
ncbi:hypothetical protein [Legionella cherrii]|uniref:hypothetical protein n=1 Tax=Legionella cherrii TaxID=28084 RepID=UPI00048F3C53|nr:hypothetical protein [Legionella cherrii]